MERWTKEQWAGLSCGAFFFLGALCGAAFSGLFRAPSPETLLLEGVYGLRERFAPAPLPLWRELVFQGGFLSLVFLAGFSVPGVLLIPALAFCRGFSALYALTLTVRAVGLAAAAPFCALTLLRLALFLPVCISAFAASEGLLALSLGRERGKPAGLRAFAVYLIALAGQLALTLYPTILTLGVNGLVQ